MYEIKSIDENKLLPLRSIARREGVTLKSGRIPLVWYGLYVDGEIVGCIGYIPRGKRAVLRGWYVVESMRGKGYGRALNDYAIESVRKKGFKEIVGNTYLPEYYEKRGWEFDGKVYAAAGPHVAYGIRLGINHGV